MREETLSVRLILRYMVNKEHLGDLKAKLKGEYGLHPKTKGSSVV